MIADFGLVCPTISESDHTGETGTYRYMASEVIRHEPCTLLIMCWYDVFVCCVFGWLRGWMV